MDHDVDARNYGGPDRATMAECEQLHWWRRRAPELFLDRLPSSSSRWARSKDRDTSHYGGEEDELLPQGVESALVEVDRRDDVGDVSLRAPTPR